MVFLKELEQWTAACEAAGEKLVVCGDLNVALTDQDVHPSQVKPGMIGQRPEERALLRAAIDHGLVDVLRRTYPPEAQVFTWWPPWRDQREKNVGWRIDFVLAHRAFASRSCIIRKDIGGSDHAPVVVELAEDAPTALTSAASPLRLSSE